jgi:uncharacterized protein YggT (Ycf19 family)
MEYITFSERPFRALKRFLYFLLWVLELLLLVQFLIELAGFNPAAPFTRLMANLTEPFVWPFQGIYPSTIQGQIVIDWSVLIAMIVYQLVLYIIVSLLELFWPRETMRVVRRDV